MENIDFSLPSPPPPRKNMEGQGEGVSGPRSNSSLAKRAGLRLGLLPSMQPFPFQPLKQEVQTEIQAAAAPNCTQSQCASPPGGAASPHSRLWAERRRKCLSSALMALPWKPLARAGLNLLHWL